MAAITTGKPRTARRNLQHPMIILCFLFVTVVCVAIWLSLSRGHDWRDSFAPAGRIWWDPYQVPLRHPPWVALLLWPIAILPLRVGFVVNGLPTIAIIAWLVLRMGGLWLAVLAGILLAPYSGIGSLTQAVAAWRARIPRTLGLLVVLFWVLVGFFLPGWGPPSPLV